MLYEIAHIIKERCYFLWIILEKFNSSLFYRKHKSKLLELNTILTSINSKFIFKTASESDINGMVNFFKMQPTSAFEFFNPHGFDYNSIKRVVENKSFLTFLVLDKDVIVGYFFLRCYANGKCFRGKIVHKDWQGKGIAKLMGIAMTKVSEHLNLRMFGSISPENYASMASAKASNDIKIHKTLDNGYYYIEFLPKKDKEC